MKKLFLIMFCMILLVGVISAADFLPIKQYDEVTKTVTIVNTVGLGRDISTIQLKTPLINNVPAGYQKVAEFEIELFDDFYEGAFDNLEFFDLNDDWKELNRQFDYKLLTYEEVWIDPYNETLGHYETREKWIDLDTSIISKGKYVIGIFTTTYKGDKVEWIPTLFGKEIDEWATWTVEGHGVALSTGASPRTVHTGTGFLVGANDIIISQINIKSGCTPGDGYIFHQNNTQIATASFSGLTATFSPHITLKANKGYALTVYDGGGSYDTYYTPTSSNFPVVETDFTWANDTNGGWYNGAYNDNVWCIESINYSVSNIAPVITINGPDNNTNSSAGTTINFNASISDEGGVTNVSLIIDGNYDDTNSSGINGTEYIFQKDLSVGSYDWIIETCDNENLCINSSERKINIYQALYESKYYNLTSYELSTETFTTNVLTNGTDINRAYFYYNGTKYSTTLSQNSNNWTLTNEIDIPETPNDTNIELFWEVIQGSTSTNSTATNQTIYETVFIICNATYITPFLNVSFKDEENDDIINASITTSTFYYWLDDSDNNKTYTFSNSTENYYYQFCGTVDRTLNTDPYIQYKQGSDYPQRVYDATVQGYSDTETDLILYLLGAEDGIYVTFQILNSANQVISGVEVKAVREISGTDVTVGQGTTGADGGVTLWLNPDFIHDFTFEKEGFTTYETSFAPTQSAYSITLSGGTTVTSSYFKGIDYSLLPTDQSLTNDTAYTFGFNLTSSFWDLAEYGFELRYKNGTTFDGGSTSTSGTSLTLNHNTINQSIIYLDYYWLINSTYTNGTKIWVVYNTDKTQWSISTFFTDLDNYLDSGFFGIDDFGRYLIIFILIFFTVGIMSYKYGLTSPLTVSTIIFLVVFFFDVVVGIIPTLSIPSGREIPYLLTFLTGLILSILIFKEVYR